MRDPVFQAYHRDGVYLRMVFEMLQCMDDDGLSVQFQELFGPGLHAHAEPDAAGKDEGYVQKSPLKILWLLVVILILTLWP